MLENISKLKNDFEEMLKKIDGQEELEKFSEEQLYDAYEFCNKMCYAYRWMRFYVDSDNEFTAALDAVINGETIGEECYELLGRAVSIVDDVCGKLHE